MIYYLLLAYLEIHHGNEVHCTVADCTSNISILFCSLYLPSVFVIIPAFTFRLSITFVPRFHHVLNSNITSPLNYTNKREHQYKSNKSLTHGNPCQSMRSNYAASHTCCELHTKETSLPVSVFHR